MQPRDRLTTKEIQVATLVWQGLTNRDIAGVLGTSEQVVKNYLRTAFDKLGVWTRLELALYVAGHGGSSWHLELGLAPMLSASPWPSPPPESVGLVETKNKAAAAAGLRKRSPSS
jgi:DNA-binding CsgD family transcriptional regulator